MIRLADGFHSKEGEVSAECPVRRDEVVSRAKAISEKAEIGNVSTTDLLFDKRKCAQVFEWVLQQLLHLEHSDKVMRFEMSEAFDLCMAYVATSGGRNIIDFEIEFKVRKAQVEGLSYLVSLLNGDHAWSQTEEGATPPPNLSAVDAQLWLQSIIPGVIGSNQMRMGKHKGDEDRNIRIRTTLVDPLLKACESLYNCTTDLGETFVKHLRKFAAQGIDGDEWLETRFPRTLSI